MQGGHRGTPQAAGSGTSLIGEPVVERETLPYQIRQKKEEEDSWPQP